MNLKYLVRQKEDMLEDEITHIWAVLDERIYRYLHENPFYYEENDAIRRLFLSGLASTTLFELRTISSNIFVITNDFPEGITMPWDESVTGNIFNEVLKKHRWITVRHGFGSRKVFEKEPGFDSHIIHLNRGDYTDFVDAFLDAHVFPVSYWFSFAKEETVLSDIERAMTNASDENDFVRLLCRQSHVVVYGMEMYGYNFLTADSELADTIRDSLGQKI